MTEPVALASKAGLLQLLVFGMVGGAMALLYVGLSALLHHGFAWPYMVAVAASYIVTVSVHFLLSQRFTFAADTSRTPQQLRRYLIYLAGHFLFSMASVKLAVAVFGWPLAVATSVSIAVATVVGYVATKYWVFAR
jgi:putative flippase GtrA